MKLTLKDDARNAQTQNFKVTERDDSVKEEKEKKKINFKKIAISVGAGVAVGGLLLRAIAKDFDEEFSNDSDTEEEVPFEDPEGSAETIEDL